MRHRNLIAWTFGMLLALATVQAFAQGTDKPTVSRQYFGLHIHRADAGTAWPSVPFGSWRLWDAYVGWRELEPERGRWDFSRLDRYMAMARLTQVDVLLPLAMTPNWASARPLEASAYRQGNSAEPARIDDWANYVRTVGQRYKGRIRHYEIWNEPSDRSHYTGSIETLVQLACTAYRVLKEIDPDVQIVSPASAGGGRHIEYLDQFLAAGGARCIDIVAHHFYVFRLGPEAMVPLIRQVRAVMAKHGLSGMPLWNTETGWWIANGDGTPDPPPFANGGWKRLELHREAPDFLARALVIARAEGVERFYWYSWDNHGMGMIEPKSGAPKPIAERWREVFEWLQGGNVPRCTESSLGWSCLWQSADGVLRTLTWAKLAAQ